MRKHRWQEVALPETRSRVEQVICQLGYRPNVQARSLRTARTNVIIDCCVGTNTAANTPTDGRIYTLTFATLKLSQ